MELATFAFLCTLVLLTGADLMPSRYVLDLDQPPEERWKEIVADKKDALVALRDLLKSSSNDFEEMAIMGATLFQYFPEAYAGEIRGIARYSGLTLGEVMVFNMLYEVSAYGEAGFPACTSILACTKSGSIIHGRNLDYHLPLLRNLTVIVDFKKSDQLIYTSVSFLGTVGILTAQKPQKFTISYDERDKGTWRDNDLEAGKVGTRGIVNFAIRGVLDDPDVDFDVAVKTLSATPLIAPSYIIVGGVSGGEGVVITHNRTKGIDVWRLGTSPNQWFLVETNYDHWEAAPESDDRRDKAIGAMRTTGQDSLDSDAMYKVLSTPLVCNSGTMYSTVMSASQPQIFKAVVRTCT